MLYTLKKTARDMFLGALLASVAWGSAIAPHVNWSLDMGNQPKALVQAANEAVMIAEKMPADVTIKPTKKPTIVPASVQK